MPPPYVAFNRIDLSGDAEASSDSSEEKRYPLDIISIFFKSLHLACARVRSTDAQSRHKMPKRVAVHLGRMSPPCIEQRVLRASALLDLSLSSTAALSCHLMPRRAVGHHERMPPPELGQYVLQASVAGDPMSRV